MITTDSLQRLLAEVRHCTLCSGKIPAPRPVLRAAASARILVIGQAPGSRVHQSGVPWDDPSGDRLRSWMGITHAQFYDESQIAIIPTGFCYPGRGRSGDLPPRPECAQTWHSALLAELPHVCCTLLIGQYAQNHYTRDNYRNLTERVRNWAELAPQRFVLPHPSPRNQLWLRRNPWFEHHTVPALRDHIASLLAGQESSKS